MRSVERAGTRKDLAREAGLGSLSLVSVLAGVLVAYGAVALLAALVAGVGGALGIDDQDLSPSDWQDAGIGAAIALGVVLVLSYFFGGYVAGRMGRRSGLAHGIAVFVLGLVVAGIVALAASAAADGDAVADELRSRGIPTSADDFRDIGLFSGVGLVAAMLVGSVLGGIKGERWHGKLVTRAQDPRYGPAAEQEKALAAERKREIDLASEERAEAEARESAGGRHLRKDGDEHRV